MSSEEDGIKSDRENEKKHYDIMYSTFINETTHKNSNFDEVVKQLNILIHYKPNDTNYHNFLGVILLEQNKPEKAKKEFKKATDILPLPSNKKHHDREKESVYVCLGTKYMDRNHKKFVRKAKNCFEKAIELNPKNQQTHHYLGIMSNRLNEHEKALECFKEVVKLETKEVKESKKEIESNPYYHDTRVELREERSLRVQNINLGYQIKYIGETYNLMKEHKKAIKYFKKAKKKLSDLNPSYKHYTIKNLRDLGDTYNLIKEHKKAEKEFKEAVKISPTNEISLNKLGDQYLRYSNKPIKALECYQKIEKIPLKAMECYREIVKNGNQPIINCLNRKAIECIKKIESDPDYTIRDTKYLKKIKSDLEYENKELDYKTETLINLDISKIIKKKVLRKT